MELANLPERHREQRTVGRKRLLRTTKRHLEVELFSYCKERMEIGNVRHPARTFVR